MNIKNETAERLKNASPETVETVVGGLYSWSFRTVILLRYYSKMRWEDVADAMRYDIRWVFRLHQRAIKAIEKDERLIKMLYEGGDNDAERTTPEQQSKP